MQSTKAKVQKDPDVTYVAPVALHGATEGYKKPRNDPQGARNRAAWGTVPIGDPPPARWSRGQTQKQTQLTEEANSHRDWEQIWEAFSGKATFKAAGTALAELLLTTWRIHIFPQAQAGAAGPALVQVWRRVPSVGLLSLLNTSNDKVLDNSTELFCWNGRFSQPKSARLVGTRA